MRCLHRGDDVQPGEARDLGRIENLRVLVAHAQVARAGDLALHALEDVHDEPVRAVADSVDAGLESGLRRLERLRVDLVRRRRENAGVAGLVGIRLEQRRAARAERAVGANLNRAHREPWSGISDRPTCEVGTQHVERAAQHDIESRLAAGRRR